MKSNRRKLLPGFELSLGYTLFYLSLLVLIPLGALVMKSLSVPWPQIKSVLISERFLTSLQLSFGASLLAASFNAVFGLILAWVLTRYNFFGKSIIDFLIDLPFALPTAVAGIALTSIYAQNGMIGSFFDKWGYPLAFHRPGVVIALIFVGIPFVTRTLQPMLKDLDPALEEASISLGASKIQTFFHVVLPVIFPGILSGFTLAFARAVGEYGSVVFISGNMPFKTEITPLLIISKLEEYDYVGASILAVAMLSLSLILLILINSLQVWKQRKVV